MWRTDLLTDALETAFKAREAELAEEQAVHGLDALEEVELHPLLSAAFTTASLAAVREQPYPGEWTTKRSRHPRGVPQRRDRLRCDVVILPGSAGLLIDPMAVEAEVLLDRRSKKGTLFESLLGEAAAAADTRPPQAGASPAEAYWLEIKLVSQFAFSSGVPGPNRSYGSELRRALSDLRKLNDDPRIMHAGLLLVIFTADEPTARHDLLELAHACLDRDIPVSSPEIRCLPIRERIGNAVLTLALFDLRKPPADP